MNTEQERAELLPCPFCGGSVSFHQDDEECRDGCHYIECKTCGMFDLSTAADPTNTVEDLGELRARIAPLWNRRAALQSQDRDDVQEIAATLATVLHFIPRNDEPELYADVERLCGKFGDHARRIEGDGG